MKSNLEKVYDAFNEIKEKVNVGMPTTTFNLREPVAVVAEIESNYCLSMNELNQIDSIIKKHLKNVTHTYVSKSRSQGTEAMFSIWFIFRKSTYKRK